MEMLRYVVLVNGLLAVVSIAYYLLLRRETFFSANRLVLWLGLASALVFPVLELSDWRPQPVRSAMQRTAQVIIPNVLDKPAFSQPEVTITFPNLRTYRAFQEQQNRFVWSWQTGFIMLYGFGVLLLLIRFTIQLMSLRKLIRQSAHEPYDDFILVHNETVSSPFSFFNWVVLNPNQHTADELDQILRHERVHVRKRHSIDMLAVELICIVCWFNPAVYLFRHLIHQILEFSADRAVLAEGIDAKTYQYNLLKVSLSAVESPLSSHFSEVQLKSRIIMLNQPNSSTLTWLKYPVVLLATLTIASAFARPQPIEGLSKYVAKPVVDALEEVVVRAKKTDLVVVDKKLGRVNKPVGLIPNLSTTSKSLTLPVESHMDSMAVYYSELMAISQLPVRLHGLMTNALPITTSSTDDKEMEAMVLAGQRKYGHLGIGPRRFGKEEIKSQSSSGSYLKVNPDGSLSVDETANYAKIFINNDPVTPQTVRSLTINQLYTLAVIYGYKPEGQEQIGTRYMLFYIDKSK